MFFDTYIGEGNKYIASRSNYASKKLIILFIKLKNTCSDHNCLHTSECRHLLSLAQTSIKLEPIQSLGLNLFGRFLKNCLSPAPHTSMKLESIHSLP